MFYDKDKEEADLENFISSLDTQTDVEPPPDFFQQEQQEVVHENISLNNILKTKEKIKRDSKTWEHVIILKEKNGKERFSIQSTIENFEILIKKYGISIKYNEITKDTDILIPKVKYSSDNAINASLALIRSLCVMNRISTREINEYVLIIAEKNRYNPVTDWILSKKWDGVSRLSDLFNTVEAKDNELKIILMRKWLINCVANVFEEKPCGNAGVLVFQGVQGMGKTYWLKKLAPFWIKDGVTLSVHNKDSVLLVIRNWIVELGELDATFKKSDVSNLKSFITADSDVIRRPYAVSESHYPRRTAFFASVNPETFLVDDTGNRRYWTIQVIAINNDHNIDIQQVFAEVHQDLFLKNEKRWLNAYESKLLEESNKDFEIVDPIEDAVRELFNWSSEKKSKLTGKEILDSIGIKTERGEVSRLGRILKKLGVERKKSNGSRFYVMPAMFQYEEIHGQVLKRR